MKTPSDITRTWAPSTGDSGDVRKPAHTPPLTRVDQVERFTDRGLLGKGGMGEVRLTHDARLERDLALKVARAPHAGAGQILLEEARNTARLEHPGIVPVYDAGRLDDGRAYYTMPVLRGRSLAQRIQEAPDLAARLRLLRHFQDACEAVAYAHERGLAHRDLKPANIMVGEFGETRVVDWGLCCPLSDPRATPPPMAGTPAYMSPEQARGMAVTPSFDIFCLGATLHELLTARQPRDGEHLREPIPRVRSRLPEVPPELAAIADRATAERPQDRYPSAKALAADVEAWFEGRRVAAHSYTLREELARFVSRWRVPLTVGTVMGLALLLALVAGWLGTRAERNRAVAAESVAVSERENAERSLARSLVSQALVAADAGRRAEAEILAANALSLGPSTDALGILARFGVERRPRLARSVSTGDCNTAGISYNGDLVWCAMGDVMQVIDLRHDPPHRRTLEERGQRAAFSGNELLLLRTLDFRVQAISLVDGSSRELGPLLTEGRLLNSMRAPSVMVEARRNLVRYDPQTGAQTFSPVCRSKGRTLVLAEAPAGWMAHLCGDRSILVEELDGRSWDLGALDPALGEPNNITADDRGAVRVAVGTERGEVVVLDAEHGTLWSEGPQRSPIRGLSLSGERLAVMSMAGDLTVWDIAADQLLTRLPSNEGALLLREDGQTLRSLGGGTIEDWVLPAPGMRSLIPMEAGVGVVEVSPDGQLAAVGLGDGTVHLIDVARGADRARTTLAGGVVKSVTFSPDGATLLAGTAGAYESTILDLELRPGRVLKTKGLRRAGWLADGTLLLVPYLPGVKVYAGGGEASTMLGEDLSSPFGDLAVWPDGRGAVLIDQLDRLFSLDRGSGGWRLLSLGTAADAQAIDSTSAAIWVAAPTTLRRYDPTSRLERSTTLATAQPSKVAASPEGRLVALGHLDGTITLWDAGTLSLVATLRGHNGRVSALAFDPKMRWMVSGSWDQTVRFWDLSVLGQEGGAMARDLESAWGRSMDELLIR